MAFSSPENLNPVLRTNCDLSDGESLVIDPGSPDEGNVKSFNCLSSYILATGLFFLVNEKDVLTTSSESATNCQGRAIDRISTKLLLHKMINFIVMKDTFKRNKD